MCTLMFTRPVQRTRLHMHGAHNTCWNACILSAKNAQALVHARACNGAEASFPWKLLRTYVKSCASIVQAVVCRLLLPPILLSRPNPSHDADWSRNPSKSTLAHDAVQVSKHHSIICVVAGLIQFVYGSHSRLVADLKVLFSPWFWGGFSVILASLCQAINHIHDIWQVSTIKELQCANCYMKFHDQKFYLSWWVMILVVHRK